MSDGIKRVHGGNWFEMVRLHGTDMVDFSASINPLGMSVNAREAVIMQLESVVHYPEQYSETFISEISSYHGIPEENILTGNGSTELIYLIPRVLKPRRALIVSPAFSEYVNSLSLEGCGIDHFFLPPENGFEFDVEGVKSRMAKGYDIIYICNPGNPTGRLIKGDDILTVADLTAARGTMCIVDEAFIDFAEGESVKRETVTRENLIVLRSMTKFFGMPGLRIGFAVANPAIIARMKEFKGPWSVNTLGAAAAAASLRDEDYIDETNRVVGCERGFLIDGIRGIPGLTPFDSSANYILVRIDREGMDAETLAEKMISVGVIIRSCSSFEGLGKGYFRVAVRKREENERLIRELKRFLP